MAAQFIQPPQAEQLMVFRWHWLAMKCAIRMGKLPPSRQARALRRYMTESALPLRAVMSVMATYSKPVTRKVTVSLFKQACHPSSVFFRRDTYRPPWKPRWHEAFLHF